MISFPNAKINLGLHVLRKRSDGFHDIETVFYPVDMHDSLEISPSASGEFDLQQYGIKISGGENIISKAYFLLREDYDLPPIQVHLLKGIPAGAGLGGGSSDAAHCLLMLNDMFHLGIEADELQAYASRLGSDCPFFLRNKPILATGRGEVLEEIDIDLSGYFIAIIKPDIHVSTPMAYSMIRPAAGRPSLREIIFTPIEEWRDRLENDFELPIIEMHPQIGGIKQIMYDQGAVYAAMSGSGSSVYGIFRQDPGSLPQGAFISVLS